MERGYAATSLRKIAAEAKVSLAAVNYHFDSKDALIREVFERRLGPLNSARIAHLDGFDARGGLAYHRADHGNTSVAPRARSAALPAARLPETYSRIRHFGS